MSDVQNDGCTVAQLQCQNVIKTITVSSGTDKQRINAQHSAVGVLGRYCCGNSTNVFHLEHKTFGPKKIFEFSYF